MPQLDFYTFSNQQFFTLICLFLIYYYNLVFFFPKLKTAYNFIKELQFVQLVDLTCIHLYHKINLVFLFFVQKTLINLFYKKNKFSSVVTTQLLNVNSLNFNLNLISVNLILIKSIGVLVIITTLAFIFLYPSPEFLIFWFLVKLVGFLFLIGKFFILDLIKFELNNLFFILKTNELAFVSYMKIFLQNLFFVKKVVVFNIKYNIKKIRLLLEFLIEGLSFITFNKKSTIKFIVFDKKDLRNEEELFMIEDLKPFVRYFVTFIICFYIIPFIFGWFFVAEGNLFFQKGASCQMEGIESLYNYIMSYLTAILFFVTTILFIIVSCGIDGNFYFEIFESNFEIFKTIESNQNLTKKINKKLLVQWYIPLFHSMKKWNHSTSLELAWTIIPTIILIFIAVPSFILLYALDEVLDAQCIVKVIAHQWYWDYEYPVIVGSEVENTASCVNVSYSSFMVTPEEYEWFSKILVSLNNDIESDSILNESFSEDFKTDYISELANIQNFKNEDDTEKTIIMLFDAVEFFNILENEIDEKNLEVDISNTVVLQNSTEFNIPEAMWLLVVDAPLVLPHSTNVRLIVTSADVLHSFAIPALGLKIDAVSGWLNQISLYAYGPGIYHGQCSELCGVKHGFMPIEVFIIDSASFQTFLFKLFISDKVLKEPFLIDFFAKDRNFSLWNLEIPVISNAFIDTSMENNEKILPENLTESELFIMKNINEINSIIENTDFSVKSEEIDSFEEIEIDKYSINIDHKTSIYDLEDGNFIMELGQLSFEGKIYHLLKVVPFNLTEADTGKSLLIISSEENMDYTEFDTFVYQIYSVLNNSINNPKFSDFYEYFQTPEISTFIDDQKVFMKTAICPLLELDSSDSSEPFQFKKTIISVLTTEEKSTFPDFSKWILIDFIENTKK